MTLKQSLQETTTKEYRNDTLFLWYNRYGDYMRKTLEAIIVVLAFAGLLINVLTSTFEDPVSLTRGLALFRYYTLQSNMIVFMYFGLRFLNKTDSNRNLHHFLGGVTVYITITFAIFAIMLSGTYHPTGWSQVSNILAHYLVPILVIGYTFTEKYIYDYLYTDITVWIIYPVVYVIFMIIHGMITDDYLYPFFQVSEVGADGLVLMVFTLVLVFAILSFLVMKIVSLQQKNKRQYRS